MPIVTLVGMGGGIGGLSLISGGGRSGDLSSMVEWNSDTGSDEVDYVSTCYDSTRKKIFCAYSYYDGSSSYAGKLAVGTISGDSITWSTPQTFSTSNIRYIAIAYDPDEDVIGIVWRDQSDSNKGKARFGRLLVGGSDTVTWGNTVEFSGVNTQHIQMIYDPNVNKFLLVCQRYDSAWKFQSVYITTDASDPDYYSSFGSWERVELGTFFRGDLILDPDTGKYLYCGSWTDAGHDEDGVIFVGQPNSGSTNAEWGDFQTYSGVLGGGARQGRLCYDTVNDKAVVTFRIKEPTSSSDDGHIYARVVTVSTTVDDLTCSYGTQVLVDDDALAAMSEPNSLCYDANFGKVIAHYGHDDTGGKDYYRLGTVSGTDISFETAVEVSADRQIGSYGDDLIYDPDNERAVFIWTDQTDTGSGRSKVL